MEIRLDQLDIFLEKNRISRETWDKANVSVDHLNSIVTDYVKNISHLNESAEFLAKVLQKCPQVHSVRWRVKDPEHLLEKIIRKRASNSAKYLEISKHNYAEIITDLVGVRILHLFKYEWLDIHNYIFSHWKPIEKVKAYIREGDEGGVVDSYGENGCDVEPHPSGYRSIHYIISTQLTLEQVVSEIQVRTIFEEGWSEIDHTIRYPNFSENKLISYFLTIFNRMAGSADEMGTFVKDLTAEIALQELKYAEVQQKHEEHISKIEALALELSKEKKQNKNRAENLKKLNTEINELRENTRQSEQYLNLDISGLSGLDRATLLGDSISALANASLTTEYLANLPSSALANASLTAEYLANLPSSALTNASLTAEYLANLPSSALTNASLTAANLANLPASALAKLDNTYLTGSPSLIKSELDNNRLPTNDNDNNSPDEDDKK